MSIAKNQGAILLGSLVATLLSVLKASVVCTWCLDVVHTSFLWLSVWFTFIESFGQESEIGLIQKMWSPEIVIITTAMTLIVQLFYLYRIFRISAGNYWIIMPIFIMVMIRMGGGIASTVALSRFQTIQQFSASNYGWLLSFGLSFAAATDVVIMATMFVILRSGRRQSTSLKNVIDRIILYTIEMGSLAAFTAVGAMVAWFAQRHTLLFLTFYSPLAKVYAIILQGSLNARYQLREAQNVHSQTLNSFRIAIIAQTSNEIGNADGDPVLTR